MQSDGAVQAIEVHAGTVILAVHMTVEFLVKYLFQNFDAVFVVIDPLVEFFFDEPGFFLRGHGCTFVFVGLAIQILGIHDDLTGVQDAVDDVGCIHIVGAVTGVQV